MGELQQIMENIDTSKIYNKVRELYRSDCIYALYRALREANVDLEELDRRLSDEFKQEEEVLEGLQRVVQESAKAALFQVDDLEELLEPLKGITERYTHSELDVERFIEVVETATLKLKEELKGQYDFDIKNEAMADYKKTIKIALYTSFMKQAGESIQSRVMKVVRDFWREAPEARMKTGKVMRYYNATDKRHVGEREVIEFSPDAHKAAGYADRQEADWRALKQRIPKEIWGSISERIYLIPGLQMDEKGNEKYNKHEDGKLSPSKGREKFRHHVEQGTQIVPSVIINYDPEKIDSVERHVFHYGTKKDASLNAADEDDMVHAIATVTAYKPVLDYLYGAREVKEKIPRKRIGRILDWIRPRYRTRFYVPKEGRSLN